MSKIIIEGKLSNWIWISIYKYVQNFKNKELLSTVSYNFNLIILPMSTYKLSHIQITGLDSSEDTPTKGECIHLNF